MRGDPADVGSDGRRARWTEHRASRRDELIDATIRAVRAHGATVGMDQIAAEAHTSKPVIYRYFSDKADLYRAVGGRMADELLVDIARAIEGVRDPYEQFRAGIDAFYRVLEHQTDLYRFVVAYPMLDGALGGSRGATRPRGQDIVADYIGRVEDLVARLLVDQPGVDLPVAQTRLWATCVVGLVRSAGEWWLHERSVVAEAGASVYAARTGAEPLTRAALTDQVTTLVWRGVAGALLAPIWSPPAGDVAPPSAARSAAGAPTSRDPRETP